MRIRIGFGGRVGFRALAAAPSFRFAAPLFPSDTGWASIAGGAQR